MPTTNSDNGNFMKTRLSLLIVVLLPLVSFAETKETGSTNTYMSNGVFLVLVSVILLLAIVIVGLAEMLKASATHNARRRKKDNGDAFKISSMIIFLLASTSLFSQTTGAADNIIPEVPFDYWGLGAIMFYVLVSVIVFEGIIVYVLFRMAMILLKTNVPKPIPHDESLFGFKMMKSITHSQSPEEENAIMMDHEYDGIRELDNNLPAWWKYGFYLTIIVSVVYLFNYHITGSGLSSKEEYELEVATAEAEMLEYKKNNAKAVDESNVVKLTDGSSISAGFGIYSANCASCHGVKGEGTVGPNFTDDNWIHGGGIVNVFKSVKYGWPDKGMKSWQQDLNPLEIQQVASYILSLRGTNPPNAKAPEGEVYVEQSDSAAVSIDSLAVMKDSLLLTKDSVLNR